MTFQPTEPLVGPQRAAALALACLVEPGTSGISESVAEHGAIHTLAMVRRRPPRDQAVGRLGPEQVPEMLDEMQRAGVRVALPGDPEFPSQLLDLPEPPLALWLRGPMDLRLSALRSVAVVGARASTAYGEQATGVLAGGLAEEGWAVVSGGAFGIDAAAHRAALGVGGTTLAVLACGVTTAYPRAHTSLFSRIADNGLVMSELPPGSQPLKHRFLARNRVIAALTRGTVVVEAARRSGAVATASRALELGRVVMAVPGPITSMASSGVNRLLHEGVARAVCEPAEAVSLLTGASADFGETPRRRNLGEVEAPQATALPPGLPPHTEQVLEALPSRGARTVVAVAKKAGVEPASCLACLGLLEIAGLAERSNAGWRRSG